MNFKCSKCFAISSVARWDEQTSKVYSELTHLSACTTLTFAFENDELGEFNFSCPVCKHETADPVIVEFK